MREEKDFTLEIAAQMLGVSRATLRTWEKEGRIPPARRDNRGWRRYTLEDIEAIRRQVYGEDAPSLDLSTVELAAPNRMAGSVWSIECEGLLCEVVVEVMGGYRLTAHVPKSDCFRLALRKGSRITVWIRPGDVLISR
jgi:molybdopterin-binding protein